METVRNDHEPKQPRGSSLARKRKTKPTGKRRAEEQRVRDRLAHAQDDAQRLGMIATTPEEALRSARVDPALQGSQQLPGVVREALKQNWATPDVAKPVIVGALLEPFFADDVVLDKDGNQVRVPPNRGTLLACAKMLKELDVVQDERDNPERAAKAKGGVEINNVAAFGDLGELLRRADEQRRSKGIEDKINQLASEETDDGTKVKAEEGTADPAADGTGNTEAVLQGVRRADQPGPDRGAAER